MAMAIRAHRISLSHLFPGVVHLGDVLDEGGAVAAAAMRPAVVSPRGHVEIRLLQPFVEALRELAQLVPDIRDGERLAPTLLNNSARYFFAGQRLKKDQTCSLPFS